MGVYSSNPTICVHKPGSGFKEEQPIDSFSKQSNVLAEKDEEIETVKKTCRGTIALLKIEVEKAEAEFSKVCMVKRELEQEVLLLQGDLDEAEATINELNSEIPRQQDILEQLNQSLGDVTARCEALQEALVRADMKCTQVTEKNEEMEDELKQVELGKRLVEQDSIDLHHKIGEQSAKQEALLDTLAKVEGQLMAQGEMLETLEDEKGSWEKERRRMKELISTLEGDNHHLEEVRMNLESSETKLKNRMRETIFENDEALKGVKSANRARARNLESRIAELELNLEEETEIRTEHEKGLKRLERVVKELELQAMEDTQSIERQVEQITNLNNRNKQLKSQFADSEARVGSLHAKLRKLTTEVEEGETRAATMTKLLSTPTASRCSTPLRHSAMMRNSVLGSRPGSRLISPEVENILLSGRNSPVGPLASLSRGNSPAPMSPLRSNSPNSQLARGRGRVFEYPGQEDVFRRHDSITEETEGSDLIQDIKQIGSVPKVKLDPSEGEEPLKPDPSSCCEVPEVQLQRPSTVENPTEGPRISVDTLDDKPKENGA